MRKVFISYVRENMEIVDRLCQELRSRGIEVWLDRNDIAPGSRWKREIRRAIQQGAFFIACFSEEYSARDSTYMNEELTIAIEELRQRSINQAWFIPVKLNECKIPDLDIGRGETLRDLQHVNLYEDWEGNIQRIREIVRPASPETINADTVEQSVDLNAVVAEFFKGLTHQNRRNYERAVEHYTAALRLNPQLTEAYNNRGNIYYNWGEHDLAIEDYDKAIELKPDYADAYNNRGIAYGNKGDYDRAIIDCDKAIELNPNYADAYSNRGAAYIERGDYDRGIEDFTKAIELDPDNALVYSNRGAAHGNKGDYDRAIIDCDKAIELDPDNVSAYSNRGAAYIKKEDYDRAIIDCDKAIELNPNYADAYRNRSSAHYKLGNYAQFRIDYNKAEELRRRL